MIITGTVTVGLGHRALTYAAKIEDGTMFRMTRTGPINPADLSMRWVRVRATVVQDSFRPTVDDPQLRETALGRRSRCLVIEQNGKFVKVRADGSTRNIPLLSGSTYLIGAALRQGRWDGKKVEELVETFGISRSQVYKMINSTNLTDSYGAINEEEARTA